MAVARDRGDTACDNVELCGSLWHGDVWDPRGAAAARARGWHVYSGPTWGGGWHRGVLCSSCARARRGRGEATVEGGEQLPLWTELD